MDVKTKAIMMFTVLSVFVFQQGVALECYSCTGCLPSIASILFDRAVCPGVNDLAGGNYCYKEIEYDGSVNRGCASAATCGAKAILPGECNGDYVQPCYICCSGDECNSATTATISMLTLCSALIAVVCSWYQ